MNQLLHLSASPRGTRSESLAIAATFLDTVREVSPDLPIQEYDLWDGTLPAFGPDAAAAKMAVFAGEQPRGAAADAWAAAVVAALDRRPGHHADPLPPQPRHRRRRHRPPRGARPRA